MSAKPRTKSKQLGMQAADFCSQRYGIVIPWEFIIGLVEWFLAECINTEQQFAQIARNPTWFQAWALRREAQRRLQREHCCDPRTAAWAVTDSLFSVADSVEDDSLNEVFGELRP